MSRRPVVATFLPTPASAGTLWSNPRDLISLAQLAEGLDFEAVWVGDHYVTSPVHGESWHDPMTVLTYLAAGTKTIGIGPAIMVTPVRQPVHLAKAAATLQYLAQGRLRLALANGFSQLEFDAVQVPINERGRRQDEILEILQRLLSGNRTAFSGRYFDFPELIMEPVSDGAVPLWVAGGSQPGVSPEAGVSQHVIDRIARADGWISQTYAPVELLAQDYGRIQAALKASGRDRASLTAAHMNFIHVVATDDQDKAEAEQRPHFEKHFSTHRTWERIRQGHLVGSIPEIVRKIRARVDVGFSYICLQPVVREPKAVETQLKLMASEILPRLAE